MRSVPDFLFKSLTNQIPTNFLGVLHLENASCHQTCKKTQNSQDSEALRLKLSSRSKNLARDRANVVNINLESQSRNGPLQLAVLLRSR